MECIDESCTRVATRKTGHCDPHYRRTLVAECVIDGCSKRRVARGWCSLHWQRWKANGDPEKLVREERQYGDTRVTSDGYIMEWMPGHLQSEPDGRVLQHRRVLSDSINRRLETYENVHHRNGDRTDNRLENLELWITRQPAGQRPQDLVEWARWILEKYDE